MRSLAAAALLLSITGCGKKPAPPQQTSAYADSRVCAGCHAEIAAKYKRTGMGRSFAPAGPGNVPASGSYFHSASNRHYSISLRDGKYFQSRWQKSAAGEAVNFLEKEIHFVMGSGNHARTFLHRTPEGKLLELPLAWYAENGGRLAMNPGYDRRDHPDFQRTIPDDCMHCHNAYPQVSAGSRAHGADAVFPPTLPEGIDCQRCHGPGKSHADAAASGKPAEQIRSHILNPKRLPPARQLEVCMQCHLESTSRALPYSIVRFERAPYSYQPAEPLANYILHFDYAQGKAPEDHFEIAHAAYRLRKSACFSKSEGKMVCTTCHDPHDTQKSAAKCAQCHAKAHNGAKSQNDCISCHMPKRRTDDVVHVVMTDHFIRKKPPLANPSLPLEEHHPPAYRGEVVPYGPQDELYTAVAQVYAGSNLLAGARRLEELIARKNPANPEYYHQLAEAHFRMGNDESAAQWFRRALAQDGNYLPSIRNLGATLTRLGRPKEAVALLARAGDDATALNNLGEALLADGQPAAAAAKLRRALELDPDSPDAWNNLGRAADGETAWREAIRLKPDFAKAHANLANRLHANGDWAAARRHFEQAVKDEDYALVRFNYGTALAERGQLDLAEKFLRDAVKLDPRLADAYLNLGNIQVLRGRSSQAIPYFQEALKVAPAMGRARLSLGVAFAQSGRMAEAEEQFRAALSDSDPGIRGAAAEALSQRP